MVAERELAVGVVAPAYVNVPLWVAQQRGFLGAEGLSVTSRVIGTTGGMCCGYCDCQRVRSFGRSTRATQCDR